MTDGKEGAQAGAIELLAPAGDFEKLETAVRFGADAVYAGGTAFSLRNFSRNFTIPELNRARDYTAARGVRFYVTVNAFPGEREIDALAAYLSELSGIAPDALIVADPGVVSLAREIAPHIPLHLSTQANTGNLAAVRFWEQQGIQRINLARELTLEEIRSIAAKAVAGIEVFVHGAMCMAYSGRCLLSAYLAETAANRGECRQACRWNYVLAEETRPGRYFPIEQDGRGSYILSAEDLCMLDHLPDVLASGVAACKIEGRMKGVHYLARTVQVYRAALDACLENPAAYRVLPEWRESLEAVRSRPTGTGFYYAGTRPPACAGDASVQRLHTFMGPVVSMDSGWAVVQVKNGFTLGETVEIVSPGAVPRRDRVHLLEDMDGMAIRKANPGRTVRVSFSRKCRKGDLVSRFAEKDAGKSGPAGAG